VSKIQTKDFIKEKFAEYYRLNSAIISPPSSLINREFAFFLLKERIMIRHKGFKDTEELRTLIKTMTPSDVYYSSAYYENPEATMDAKEWLGADLVFDIDADHIPTSCDKQHDTWTCNKCGAVGRGAHPEECQTCKGQKFEAKSWPCEKCIESAKREAIKLVDFLINDFGLSSQEIILAFSGHRGYHVHVEEEVVQTLDQLARKEIVDYVVGIGLEPEFHGLGIGGGPRLKDLGWKGRIAEGIYEFLLNTTPEQLNELGLKRSISSLLDQRKKILESWKKRGLWRIYDIGPKNWEKIVQKSIENQSVKIDTVVTTDIHRLIRLTNTLHGKTGMKKIHVLVNDIECFDPWKSALAFKGGSVKLIVLEAPEFRLGDDRYGPYQNREIALPTAPALFLLCKGAAQLKEED